MKEKRRYKNLPSIYNNHIAYINPTRLRRTYDNYFLIVTQDEHLKALQQMVRDKKLSKIKYENMELRYLKREYNLNFNQYKKLYTSKSERSKY